MLPQFDSQVCKVLAHHKVILYRYVVARRSSGSHVNASEVAASSSRVRGIPIVLNGMHLVVSCRCFKFSDHLRSR